MAIFQQYTTCTNVKWNENLRERDICIKIICLDESVMTHIITILFTNIIFLYYFLCWFSVLVHDFLQSFSCFTFYAGNVMSVIDGHVYICWAIGCSLTNDWTSPHCHIFTSWCLSLFIWSLVGQEGPSKVWWCIITFIVIVSQLILRRSWWACQICHAGNAVQIEESDEL